MSAIAPVASTSDEETVVKDGENGQASYSADGSKMLFVSWKRPNHSQPQIYEKILGTGTERRLTYQNGSTFLPRYHPTEPLIVYSSTTDELKENSPLLNPAIAETNLPAEYQQPTEVYMHAINGLEITRLTERHGFDGEAKFTADGKQLMFTRIIKNRASIALINHRTKGTQVLGGLGVNPTNYVSSPDRKTTAWIEWDLDFKIAKLKIKRPKEATTEVNAEHQVSKSDLVLSPDNRYLVWSQLNAIGGNFEIWVYDTESKCPYMMVGSDSADRRYPVFTPDMKTLTYTMVKGERSRIVNLPFVPPTGPCSKED